MTPALLTEDDVLAYLPPFERATARHAARAVVEAMRRGLSLRGAAREATAQLAAARRRVGEASTPAAREGAARLVARHERELRCALVAAQRTAQATDDESLATFAVQLTDDPSWRVVVTAFDVLSSETQRRGHVPRGADDRANGLARQEQQPVWTQVAAWRFLSVAAELDSSGRARELLARALAMRVASRRADSPDDVFVRAAVASLLAAGPASVAVPALEHVASDPSEHVRMSAVAALGALRAERSLRRFAHAATEPSPRVRAVALIALAPQAPEALGMALLTDPSETTRRAALEEAERFAPDNDGLRAVIDEVAVAAPSSAFAALAADAAERLHHRCDARATQTLDRLRAEASMTAVGAGRELELSAVSDDVGRALAVLASNDHGLSLERIGAERWRLQRGDVLRRRWWRVLHEATHPSPDKRQGQRHTIGRVVRGEVRAPTGILAEVSPTRVPGERVFVATDGGWGRHLPTVDDLLERPPEGVASLYSSLGVTRIAFPPRRSWTATRARLALSYAHLARLRLRALESADATARGLYVRALVDLGFGVTLHPHRALVGSEIIELFGASGASGGRARLAASSPGAASPMLGLLPATGLLDRLSDVVSVDLAGLHTVNQVAAVGAVALGLMTARLVEARREIDRARAALPLSIGGWGTRGKSGTERLKAALFQGLGCEVFVKTTGCEAMFLHAIPDLRAEEIFLYRTYDKATIWEQRDTLQLAARLGVDVFLWECMALNPAYVDILERRWMRDDLCTLTNAYPDHENVQGPSGMDVARVLAELVPRGKVVLTAEDQMLPVLRDAAVERGARLVAVGWREVELLPEDLLARFSYREHPRNIALVLALAAELGVERDVALKEMADWLVPDLGVLKTYPEARWRGRRLEFSNGMSANERTGFLGNWTRLGFDGPDAPGTWVVTVVNNRGDRNARTAVFADIVARDIAAHRHVVIGTNVRGFARAAEAALRASLAERALVHAGEEALPAFELTARVLHRGDEELARFRLGALGAERLSSEAAAIAEGLSSGAHVPAKAFASLFADDALRAVATSSSVTWFERRARVAAVLAAAPALTTWTAALGEHGPDAVAHLVDLATRHQMILAWRAEVAGTIAAEADRARALRRVARSFRDVVVALFRASLFVVDDPGATGDQVVDAVAGAAPPGFRVRIMGTQNIKGTGLDFAYRWVALERTTRTLEEVRRRSDVDPEGAHRAARDLLARDDLGILDLEATARAFADGAGRAPLEAAEAWRLVGADLDARRAAAEGALEATAKRRPIWGFLERVLDVWDGVRRTARARRHLDALVAGRASHAETATAMRALMTRQKGGWLGAKRSRR